MASELYVAVISDILDSLGFRDQVLDASLHPLGRSSERPLVGRASTLRFEATSDVLENPYDEQIRGIDTLAVGDVVVLAGMGLRACAIWGELFSTAAAARGARGAVIDGYHRDTRMIESMGFPTFSTGPLPRDIAGRAHVVEVGGTVSCAGVSVDQGDIVFAERDGIAVIPAAIAEETIDRAFEKISKEDNARDDLRRGDTLAEVWSRYRVL
jgi:4-hydroxy-4-methyl-2-oxoglutarate aldolase